VIVYLHGFASSERSYKARMLREWLAPIPVLAPSYPQQPRRAIPFLLEYILREVDGVRPEHLLLVGSSLGGFYGEYLARRLQCSLVLINPALDPVPTLHPWLGENRIYYSEETFSFLESDLRDLEAYAVPDPCASPVPTLLLVDQGDEVLDASVAVRRYEKCAQCVAFPGGNHGFAHLRESLEYIQHHYRSSTPVSALTR